MSPQGRSARPRVLVVSFNRLFPADQGNARRITQLVAQYRHMGMEVDLIYHSEEGFDPALAHALSQSFGWVRVVRSKAPKRILAGHVCHLADWYDAGLEPVAHEMHRLRQYAVVHVNYIWYAPLLASFGPQVLKVLDSHDIFADRTAKYRQAGMVPNWFSTTLQEEDRAFRMADAVLAIQREEAQEMTARGHPHILYLPYVEPQVSPFAPRSAAAGELPVLGYLGSGNDWNVRSIQAFLAALARQSEGAELPFRLLIGGGICHALRDMPGVTLLGFVKELATFYNSIDLALNPMVGGTGLKIKTVEPLSFGKPVLTTPAGAQGLQHLWAGPCFESAEALASYLLGEFAANAAAALQAHRAEAALSRQALDEEYRTQLGKLAGWIQRSVG
jgi:glycosyltransferase involved in cell wall biosynthesis